MAALILACALMVLAGCDTAADIPDTKTLTIGNRSSVAMRDIKWSDVSFAANGAAMLAPEGTATAAASAGAASGKGYVFFTAAEIAFRSREAVSFADSDTFTFTNNTIVVQLSRPSETGTLAGVLHIPDGVVVTPGNGSVTAGWNAVDGAVSYRVYCAADTALPDTPALDNITGTSATVTGLENGRVYCLWVRAAGAGFVSMPSGMKSAATPVVFMAGSAAAFRQAVTTINADIAGAYSIVATGDFSTGAVTFAADSDRIIVIEGDGTDRVIANGGNNAFFTVPSGVTLALGRGITLDGNGRENPAVKIEAGGTLVMNSGSVITGAARNGVDIDGGTFIMTGGAIRGNSVTAVPGALMSLCFGGGVYVRRGSFTMSGGTISGNSAYFSSTDPGLSAYCYGGGVFVFGGSFSMTGGAIRGNSVSNGGSTHGNGGGVYVGGKLWGGGNGSFTMTGGTIDSNTVSAYGGGVYVGSGTFAMTGGAVSGNTAAGSGGGVYVGGEGGGIFTMTGGMISGNTASGFAGGGVAVEEENGRFIKTGGTIDASNTAQAGRVAYAGNYRKRETAAGPGVNLDSNTAGSAGGWE